MNNKKNLNMTIGVLLTAYNSEKYIDECLDPWLKLKSEFDIFIGCNSGMFKDYLDLGFKPNNKKTLSKLVEKDLDFLVATGDKILLDEDSSRNTVLNTMKKNCDLIWILDSDEFYTEDEIRNIIKIISETPQYDWYSINFRNYTLTENLWTDGYCPPRIFRTDRYDGISHFYFDNHIVYNNGDIFDHKPNFGIPRNIAWVKHYSWLEKDPRTKEKIKYQNHRFSSGCSFDWDENSENKLKFSNSFYNSRGMDLPILHETDDVYSSDFTLTFSRSENKFYIQNIIKNQILNFKFYNGDDDNLFYQTVLDIAPGVNYFCYPGVDFSKIEVFKKFRIEVLSDNKVIHSEFLHIFF
jgi:hypothetical protein